MDSPSGTVNSNKLSLLQVVFGPRVSSQQPRATDIPTHTKSIVRIRLKESFWETVDHEGHEVAESKPRNLGDLGGTISITFILLSWSIFSASFLNREH